MKTPKTTFRAVSPFTGHEFTRTSAHAYTHSCVSFLDTAGVVARIDREMATSAMYAEQYRETIRHLKDGTAPEAGSVLLRKASSQSYNTLQAGVKTEWDSIQYDIKNPKSVWAGKTLAEFIEMYEGFLAGAEKDVAQKKLDRAAALKEMRNQEFATFHHSAKLAEKEAGKVAKYEGNWVSKIVEARPAR